MKSLGKPILIALLSFCAIALSACGRGGNSTPTGSTTAPFMVNGTTATLTVGQTATFQATGGGDGNNSTVYYISDSTGSVAKSTIQTNGSITITGISQGTDTVTASDQGGDTKTIAVTVTGGGSTTGGAPQIEAPAANNLIAGTSSTYAIIGGTPPYRTASSAQSIAEGTIGGTNLIVNAISVGTATIPVYDANGLSSSIAVNVTSGGGVAPLITSAPTGQAVVVAVNGIAQYTIFGGIAPYIVTTNNGAIAAGTITNTSALTITGKGAGSAILEITDSAHTQIQIPVTVGTSGGGTTGLTISAPNTITVGTTTPSTYSIFGGVPPYTASVGNTKIATPTILSATNQLSVLGLVNGGSTTLAVFDSTGASQLITVNVSSSAVAEPIYTDAGSAITLTQGEIETYNIGGGTGPYTVVSNEKSVASLTYTANSYTVTGVSSGIGLIVIQDSLGVTYTLTIQVL